ncbi:fibronectin type III domain-containing protein [Listeria booriae]|uniref:fibronectin type III domain-containing protein n=1 Tax=Listeria booriae TaxID=1552123 RepID=UPI00162A584D|nr:fibronectin type III domain-containing protein [Listeria booriae]MBC2163417.1 fibronectin type III domain-containing protein [Listeria booriae]
MKPLVTSIIARQHHPIKPQGIVVSSFTDESISLEWEKVQGASKYFVYVDELIIESKSNSTTIHGLTHFTFYSIQVSAYNKVEGAKSDPIIQKTKIKPGNFERYILDSTYMKGETINDPAVTNARIYVGDKYMATGTVTNGAISIYMTGVLGANYAKSVALEINGVVKPTVAVSQDGTFRYYAKNLITSTSDTVKVLLYNRANAVMETLLVDVVANNPLIQAPNIGSSVNQYVLGDGYVTGTYNTAFIVRVLDGKSSGDPTAIEGMPAIVPIELPKLTVNPVSSVTGIVSGTTENNGQVRVSVDGTAKTVLTAGETGNYSGNISGIISGSSVFVEAKVGTAYPASVTVTVPAPPGAPPTPTNLAVSAVTSTTATLSWNASAGATSYKIFQNGYTTVWKTTTAPSYALTGAAGTTWTYQVSAVNANGDSLRTDKVTVTYLP